MSAEITLPPQGMNIQGTLQAQSAGSVGNAKGAEGASEVASILGTDNVTVTDNVGAVAETANPLPAADLPVLDAPKTRQQEVYAAIDKLLAVMQLEDNEKQVQMSKERISASASLIEAEFNERTEKIVIMLSLMKTLGDRLVGSFARREGAAIAAFSAAVVSMAPSDQKTAALAFMGAISNDARRGGFGFFFSLNNDTLRNGLKSMGLDSAASSVQYLISEGAFDQAAKLCGSSPLTDILDKAATLQETAKAISEKFSFFGKFNDQRFLGLDRESRMKALANELEELFAKLAAQEEGASPLDKLIESVNASIAQTAAILGGMKGTDVEISGQMNQMA